MTKDIGVAVAGLEWMGQVHSRGCGCPFEHHPDRPFGPRLVKEGAEGAGT